MKIYDDAHKLAKQIRESKEYKEYKELKENMIVNVKIRKFDNNRLIGEIIEIKERN